MPYRRRRKLQEGLASVVIGNLLGLHPSAVRAGLTHFQHHHASRTGHYPVLGNPLEVGSVSQRRKSPISETTGKKSTGKKILSNTKAMPYRRKSTYKKRSRPRRRRRLTKLPPLVLPRHKIVRFRLVFGMQMAPTGGAIATSMIKANDLNDPTGALTAQLPIGIDQWASQYQKYIVLGSKITCRFNHTTGTGMVVAGIHLDDDSTALTSHSHYRELPLTKQCILTPQKDYGTVVMKYSGKRFWRLANIKDDSEQEGSFSTTPGSPTDIAYFHIYSQDLVANQNATLDTQVELEYIVLLTEPVTLAQSSL